MSETPTKERDQMSDRMTWAQEYRIKWIAEMLDIYGFVNRHHIMRKFRTSTPQAAADLRLFRAHFPNIATYDNSRKAYVTKDTPHD